MNPIRDLADWATDTLSGNGIEAIHVVSELRRPRTTFLILEGRRDGRAERFALKAFNPGGEHNSREAMLWQYEALRVLHEATSRDGDAACPKPVAAAPSLWAYLMEYVDGVDVSRWRCTDQRRRAEVAGALVDVLDAYYRCGLGHYGDWTPRNVLIVGTSVKAIDPGIHNPVDEATVRDPELRFQPAAGDAVRWLWRASLRLNHVIEQRATAGTLRTVTEGLLFEMGMRFADGDVASFLDDVLGGIGRERGRARPTIRGRSAALGAHTTARALIRRVRKSTVVR